MFIISTQTILLPVNVVVILMRMFYFLKFNLYLLEGPFDCTHPGCANILAVSFVIESISILILNLYEKKREIILLLISFPS